MLLERWEGKNILYIYASWDPWDQEDEDYFTIYL